MGAGFYDRDVTAALPTNLLTKQTTLIDDTILPKNKELVYPANSTPIVIACDVTGSRGDDVRVLYEKLPLFYSQLVSHGYIENPVVSFAAIGDATDGDVAPIQVTEFTQGTALDEQLSKLFIEGGGGGSGKESYELIAYYYANHCKPSEPQQNPKKGYFFITGDEAYYPSVVKEQIQQHIGDEVAENLSTASVFQKLQEHFNVYFLFPSKRLALRGEDIDIELDKRLARQNAKAGNVCISLFWNNGNDLDLHVYTPSNEHIYYGNREGKCGGILDVDMNAGGNVSRTPVENIYWPKSKIPKGKYVVEVKLFSFHERQRLPTKCMVQVRIRDKVTRHFAVFTTQSETKTVCEFEYEGDADNELVKEVVEDVGAMEYAEEAILDEWRKVIPRQHIFMLRNNRSIVDMMLGAIAISSGVRTCVGYLNDLVNRGQSIERRFEVVQALRAIESPELRLLNLVSAAIIGEPKLMVSTDKAPARPSNVDDELSNEEITRNEINRAISEVAESAPEFLLKLALYVRDDLNIRSTANYIVAKACTFETTRPFLKKYFGAIVRLPSDMLDIVTMVRKLNNSVIPKALRQVVKDKFKAFDAYSLAKYNKEKAVLRKLRKIKKKKEAPTQTRARRGGRRGAVQREPTVPDTSAVNLKQLIRLCHIAQPAELVMGIIGKKYPSTQEQFTKSGLSGEFDASQAGNRMKLPVPETWERLLSDGGNTAANWATLLDNNNLPFMAMLRNLRNIIISGIDERYHQKIIGRLTNERAVAGSRQFPFRFLSAFEILKEIEKLKAESQGQLQQLQNADNGATDGATDGARDNDDDDSHDEAETEERRKQKEALRAKKLAKLTAIMSVSDELLQRYRDALNESVKLAIAHNLKPIRGHTAIVCDTSVSMREGISPTSAKGLGTKRTSLDIALLMSLMLNYCSEQADFYVMASALTSDSLPYAKVELPDSNSILESVKYCTDFATQTLGQQKEFPYKLFEEWISNKTVMDRMVLFSDMRIDELQFESSLSHLGIEGTVALYREKVNPNFTFVLVDVYGSGASVVNVNEGKRHPRDLIITGYSDQIFRFITEKETDQLSYVRNIDQTKLNKPAKQQKQAAVGSSSMEADDLMDI